MVGGWGCGDKVVLWVADCGLLIRECNVVFRKCIMMLYIVHRYI